MKGDFNCSGTEDNLDIVHGSCLPLLQRFSRVFSRVCSRALQWKKKGGRGEGRWRGLQTQARASLSKHRVRLWTFLSRKGVPSFLRARKESGTGFEIERERCCGANWLETDGVKEKEREEGENDSRHSFTTVSAFWTVVSDSCSIMWRWILDHWFFVSITVFLFFFFASVGPWTQFFLFWHAAYTCTSCLEHVLVFSPQPPSFICTPPVLVLIFHLRIVTRGWKNWTNHGKWKSASTKSVCSRVLRWEKEYCKRKDLLCDR